MDSMSSFWTLFIVIDLIIFWFIFRAIRRNRGNRKTRRRNAFFLSSPSPSSLSQERHPEITELMQLLEQSIPVSYAHSVRNRVMEAHPEITEQEYDWRWHELKRYFMLCAIMNRVPMFSSDVDELWHEMLMFTREYQQFSEAFLVVCFTMRPILAALSRCRRSVRGLIGCMWNALAGTAIAPVCGGLF